MSPIRPYPTRLPKLRWVGTQCYGTRTRPVRLIVGHDPEGTYEGTTRYIKNKRPDASGVSYHVLLNAKGDEAVQFVRWAHKAWSCRLFNSWSDNISIAGFAGNNWSYAALNKMARVVAMRLRKRGLPATFVSAPVNPLNPRKGFTFHSELGVAGGSHHDMGLSGAKRRFYIAAVKFHYRIRGFRPRWGK